MSIAGVRPPPNREVTEKFTTHLASRTDVRLAILFGSAARDAMHAGSDIDLAVALTDGGPEKMLSLGTELSALGGREVDLLDLTDLHGFILREVLTQGVLLVRRDGSLYESLIRRMLFEESDWLPIKRAAMKEQLESFLS
jgi:predicted nucleotidyltransferase